MHLPDHYLDPLTCAATAVLSGGAITYSLIRVRHEPATKVFAAAATSAAIFAAQMINFPVASGTSGHLLGGALAGVLLGPWAGLLAMAAVLLVQAVVFGDGGVLALGANILNMGVIGVAIGAAANRVLSGRDNAGYRIVLVAIAAWLSVAAAAFACALEMAVSGTAAVSEVMPAMLSVHALIGLAEAAITAAAVVAVWFAVQQSTRQPSVSLNPRFAGESTRSTSCAAVGWLLAAVILVGVAPLSSSLPDGLSRVADSLQSTDFSEMFYVPAVFSDYEMPGIAWPPLATWLAALLGAGLVYSVTAATVFFCHRLHLQQTSAVK